MSAEICDRCGAKIDTKATARAATPACPECVVAVMYLRIPPGAEDRVISWFERVIDRRVQKVLAERELP